MGIKIPTQSQLAQLESRQAAGGPGFFQSAIQGAKDVATGTMQGIPRDPLVEITLKKLGEIAGINTDALDELKQKSSGSTATQFGRMFGEFLPTLLIGIPTAGGGAALTRAGLQGVAKKFATQTAAKELLEAAARTGVKQSLFKNQLTRVSARAASNKAGAEALIQGTPGLQRAAESVGANVAFGNVVAGQELARGKEPVEALKTAALVTAFGLGIDGVLVGVARGLFPGSRSVDLVGHKVAFEKEFGPKSVRVKEIENMISRRKEMAKEIDEVLGTKNQQLELFENGAPKTRMQRLREVLNPGEKPVRPKSKGTLYQERLALAREEGTFAGMEVAERKAFRQTWRDEATRDAKAADAIYQPLRAQSKLAHTNAARVKTLMRDRNLTRTELRQARTELAEAGTLPYLGNGPAVGPIKRLWDALDPNGKFRMAVTTAPESLFGAFGSTGNRTFTQIMRASDRAEKWSRVYEQQYSHWSETARRAVGETENVWKNGLGKNLDSAHAWEKGREDGLRAYMRSIGRSNGQAEEIIGVFQAHEKFQWQILQVEGRKVGAKAPLDLRKMEVKAYLSHPGLDLPDEEIAARLTAPTSKGGAGLSESEAREIMKNRGSHLDPDPVDFEGYGSGTPSRIAPLDFDRVMVGSTKEKIHLGMPLNPNIWDAQLRMAQGARRRLEFDPILGGQRFDKKAGRVMGRRIESLVKAVEAEGYNGAKFRTVLETVAGKKYYNESMRKIATGMTSVQVASKLSMAFMANATQPILTTTWAGMRPSFKAAFSLTSRARREEFAQALAVHEHIIRGIGRSVDDEGLYLTSFERAADWTLRFTQFNRIERWNRIHAAATTQMVIRDSLAKGFKQRLRGVNLDAARRNFGELGLDFDGLVRKMDSIGPEALLGSKEFLKVEETAILRGAQKTQFFPGATRTPSFWKHPVGRVLFQFKTFAVGQSRFMRDAVLTEWSHGNLAPMATFLAFSPIAGELVGDGRAIINGKDRTEHGIARALDNAMYIGGLGLFTDVLGQAKWGNLSSVYFGPSVSDLTQLFEAVISGQGQSIFKLGSRQPAFKMTKFAMGAGVNTVQELDEYLDAMGVYAKAQTIFDVGQLTFQRAQEKR